MQFCIINYWLYSNAHILASVGCGIDFRKDSILQLIWILTENREVYG